MNLSDLNNEVKKTGGKVTIVNFSDLHDFDNWDAKFWIGLEDSINEYRKNGKDKTIDTIVELSNKIGEKNYNSLKSISDSNKFGVPSYETVIDKKKLKTHSKSNGKLIILLDLLTSKVAERRKKLENDLAELQKELDKLL